MSDKLKELDKETGEYLKLHWSEGGTSEFDMSINDISRAKIEEASKIWPEVYLGKVNLYGDERQKTYEMVKYTGQKVYNFEYSFIVPVKDPELEKMIDNRDKSVYTGTSADYIMIKEIHAKMESIGGINLIWA